MRILLLGGTRFVGRHLVQEALARGHSITLFNRGKTNLGLFPNVETRIGDRDGGLKALEEGTWDAVIDTCGYVPRIVGDSARLYSKPGPATRAHEPVPLKLHLGQPHRTDQNLKKLRVNDALFTFCHGFPILGTSHSALGTSHSDHANFSFALATTVEQ